MTDIILAGKTYEIGQLTLGQMRRLRIGLVEKAAEKSRWQKLADGTIAPADLDQAELVAALNAEWNQQLEVVAAALSKAYPDMTVQALLDSDATPDELMVAYVAVLRHAGLVKDTVPGEAGPGADAPSAGDGSTAT